MTTETARTITETVQVTAEHIAASKCERYPDGRNPIFLALRELHPGIPVDVYSNWAHLCGTEDGCKDADFPGDAEDFMGAFYTGDAVAPIEFTLYWEPAEDDEDDSDDI